MTLATHRSAPARHHPRRAATSTSTAAGGDLAVTSTAEATGVSRCAPGPRTPATRGAVCPCRMPGDLVRRAVEAVRDPGTADGLTRSPGGDSPSASEDMTPRQAPRNLDALRETGSC